MRKIPPTILIIVISLFLSGCIGSGSSGSGFSSGSGDGFSSSGNSVISYYSPPSDPGDSGGGGDSGVGGGAAGHHNPEPASLALMGAGLAALLGKKLRRRK
jgi:hypothetical protein